jgi:hypothetical protein
MLNKTDTLSSLAYPTLPKPKPNAPRLHHTHTYPVILALRLHFLVRLHACLDDITQKLSLA